MNLFVFSTTNSKVRPMIPRIPATTCFQSPVGAVNSAYVRQYECRYTVKKEQRRRRRRN